MGRILQGSSARLNDPWRVPVFFMHPRNAPYHTSFRIVGAELERALVEEGVAFHTPDVPALALREPYYALYDWPQADLDRFARAKHRVVMDVVDGDELSADRVKVFSELDQVWFPSNFSCNTAIACGVPAEKVRRLPHGVNPMLGRFYPRHMSPALNALAAEKRVKFGWALQHSPIRKGADIMYRAYGRLCDRTKDTVLVIRTANDEYDAVRRDLHDARIPEDRVIIMNGVLSVAALSNWYKLIDAFVYPTRGGAFELQPLEAICCGTPAIVTGHGAPLDYANAKNALLIKPSNRKRWLYEGHGHGVEPDVDHFVTLMQLFAADPKKVKEKLTDLGDPTLTKWTWYDAALFVKQHLAELGLKI